jgi:lipopolysaccharide biosynthesis protein
MPGETIAPSFWRETAGLAFSLAPGLEERLGGSPPDHFSGTMFWVRPKALAALKGVGLSARFEAERAKTGGTLEHALEMAFPSVVRLAGYDVAEINGLCP